MTPNPLVFAGFLIRSGTQFLTSDIGTIGLLYPIHWLYFMWTVKFEGDIDIGFYLWVNSVSEFSEKWFSFLTKYRKYILKQEIYESVTMVHYPMKPLIDKYEVEEKIR